MNITEFAESRGVKVNVISNYLARHAEVKKYTVRKGKEVELEPEAIEILGKAYPLPKPIEIIEDTESREKLLKAQELIIQLQDKLNQAQSQIAKAEAVQLLLEDKKEQLNKAEAKIKEMEAEAEALKYENKSIEAENERLKNRGLIARILNN